MKKLKKVCAALMALPIILHKVHAQDNNAGALINAKHYVFKANSVSPARGGIRQLTPGYYTLRLSGDTLIADLPYFGQAYSAPIDPAKAALTFKTTGYKYEAVSKKQHWNITIKTGNASEANGVTQLYLTVYNDGNASLQVTSLNRQTISFYGVVEAK